MQSGLGFVLGCLMLSACGQAMPEDPQVGSRSSPTFLQPISCEEACRQALHEALGDCGRANGRCNSGCNARCAQLCSERPRCMGRCEARCTASCRRRHQECRADASQDYRECLADCQPACPPGLTDCNGTCVNLETDVRNCGTCGRICELPNASPICEGGQCRVGQCATQFSDCDGLPENGCENAGPCPPLDGGPDPRCTTNADCDDQDQCTEDICQYQGAGMFECVHDPFCDDQNPCTIDTCTPQPGAATPQCDHRDRFCEDQDPCTTDSCNPMTGDCEHGDTCDDGDPCTRDICDPTSPVLCDHEPVPPPCP